MITASGIHVGLLFGSWGPQAVEKDGITDENKYSTRPACIFNDTNYSN